MADSMDVDKQPAPQASGSVAKGKGAAGNKDEPRFVVKKWNAVALWSWDIVVDNCAICRNHIMDLCGCTVAWGVCNHAFHYHCINRWLKTRNANVYYSRTWELQRYGR
ncbi:hypothetical protein FFLO_00578 [Filobasidium floriforme]|uniref:Zinc finger RING-H2-type domain-containing protein n=1 Tax=Filobasidium floriforme TaxID=5210 RepID=A0A8K0JR26_9TREE|nr:hypothetical protein FFLO_00578 [Filobasidium floriforme]